jgi:hypothetical protein
LTHYGDSKNSVIVVWVNNVRGYASY